MSALAINRAGKEVGVYPIALMTRTSERRGFVYAPCYTVSLCWMSGAGEICSYGVPSYSGFDLAAARREQKSLVTEHGARAVAS